jgi:hypothetical protein
MGDEILYLDRLRHEAKVREDEQNGKNFARFQAKMRTFRAEFIKISKMGKAKLNGSTVRAAAPYLSRASPAP